MHFKAEEKDHKYFTRLSSVFLSICYKSRSVELVGSELLHNYTFEQTNNKKEMSFFLLAPTIALLYYLHQLSHYGLPLRSSPHELSSCQQPPLSKRARLLESTRTETGEMGPQRPCRLLRSCTPSASTAFQTNGLKSTAGSSRGSAAS